MILMLLLIDYHSGLLADAIAPEEHLALIAISDPGFAPVVRPGWAHLLLLNFDDEGGRQEHSQGFSDSLADRVIEFCYEVGNAHTNKCIVIRCDSSKRRSAAIAKALGEWCLLWTSPPGLRYSRQTFLALRERIGRRRPPVTLNGVRRA
jgi:hypothetical protein